MGIFNKNRTDGETYDGQGEERKGLIDVISYNGEADEIVWKFPYDNLSTATQVVVNQSQEVIFVKGGAFCDVLGASTHTLSANNIPILQKLINLPFGGKSPFKAEVWYISKTIRRNLKFGTMEPVELIDPIYGVPIPVRSFGEFGIQVSDSSAFMQQMVGTLHLFTTKDIIEQFKSLIVRKLSVSISKFILRERVSVVQISGYLDEISNYVRDAINEEFAQYGLRVTNFDVASINYDKDDERVKEVMSKQAEASGLGMLRGQADMYQMKRQLDIMETAAGNEGGAGQMMGAGMGLGMGFGIGGAFGQQMGNIAGVMQQQQPQTPPPPPAPTTWHILINSQQYQYDQQTVQQYVQSGQITRDTFVWKNGMAQWVKAVEVPELQNLFGAVPPPPPPIV